MKISFVSFWAVFVLVISVLISPLWAETIWKTEDEFVRIVASQSRQANSHPLKISADSLLDILLKLDVFSDSKQGSKQMTSRARRQTEELQTKSLFSEVTAERLAAHLSSAFQKVEPDQDILFKVKDNVSIFGGSVGKPVLTTGRVFWRDKRLNIIFGSIHKTFKKKYLLGRETRLISPPVLPVRSRSVYPGEVIAGPTMRDSGIAFARVINDGKRGYRRDWVIISPESFLMTRQNLDEDVVQKKKNQRMQMRERAVSNDALQDPLHKSMEARLRRLKDLYEKDLITEEMYHRGVEKVLEAERN